MYERKRNRLIYNLQFFADDPEPDPTPDPEPDPEPAIDPSAFAEIISEKDKKIEELTAKNKALEKSNANLLLKISAGSHSEKTTEEKIYGLINPERK